MIFVDKPQKAELLLEGVENKLTPCLKVVIVMDSYDTDLVERGKKCGVEITSMKAMEVSRSPATCFGLSLNGQCHHSVPNL